MYVCPNFNRVKKYKKKQETQKNSRSITVSVNKQGFLDNVLFAHQF